MNRVSFSPKSAQRGVALIEAMVAILLFSIGVLAVAGLQASMLRNAGDAKYRADAAYIAQQRLALLWANPGTVLPTDLGVDTPVPELPNGKLTITRDVAIVSPTVGGQFRVVVTWQPPGDPQVHNYTVLGALAGV